MTDRALPVTAILAAGIGMGLAGDQLLRASGRPRPQRLPVVRGSRRLRLDRSSER